MAKQGADQGHEQYYGVVTFRPVEAIHPSNLRFIPAADVVRGGGRRKADPDAVPDIATPEGRADALRSLGAKRSRGAPTRTTPGE